MASELIGRRPNRIKFGSFYFAADQIAAIKREKSLDAQFPESIILQLKDGRSYALNYKTVGTVELEMARMAREIEKEQIGRLEKIADDICTSIYYLKSLEKRQLRILRILRKLPFYIETEGDDGR